MSNQVKVKNTEKYSDSQGTHIVCKGKLLFIKSEEAHNSLFYDDGGKSYYYKPTIISETEEIEVGDYHINMHTSPRERSIQQYTHPRHLKNAKKDWRFEYECKVLALPEHFSEKHLQAIVDGKMKDGDGVLVKCEEYIKDGILHDGYEVHLDQQNHITLFPAKQSVNEAAETYALENAAHSYGKESLLIRGFKAGAKWAKKNNY